MKKHPLNDLIASSIDNINYFLDISKVVGNPIVLPDSSVALPISKVSFGFGALGSEFTRNTINPKEEYSEELYPFGGGSGGGITIAPAAMIVLKDGKIKMIRMENSNPLIEKIVETVGEIIKK